MMVKKFLQSIEDFFFPTLRNKMCPYGLSRLVFLFYFFLGVTLAASSVYWKASHLATPIDIITFNPEEIVQLVNESRKAVGLETLVRHPTLDRAAQQKASDMFKRQYFAHVTPANESPWIFFKNEGYTYRAAGENLAMDFFNAFDAHRALMASEAHRANILSPLYQEIGVAVLPGEFKTRPSIIVVQLFGAPRVSTVATYSAPPASAAPSSLLSETATQETPAVLAEHAASEVFPMPSVAPIEKTGEVLPVVSKVEPRTVSGVEPGYRMQVRLLALIIIALTTIPALFLIVRTGLRHARILIRPVAIISLFIFIGWFGGFVEPRLPALTATAESTVAQCGISADVC